MNHHHMAMPPARFALSHFISSKRNRQTSLRAATLILSMKQGDLLRRIRFWLALFMSGLILSGVTAFPLEMELKWMLAGLHADLVRPIAQSTHLLPWIERVYQGLHVTNTSFPFLAYGTDWLAFAHLVLAAAFIGPYLDPVRNKWVINFGLYSCAGVIPLALIAGHMRGIPFPWRLIDCSFGIFGSVPLLFCRHLIRVLEDQSANSQSQLIENPPHA